MKKRIVAVACALALATLAMPATALAAPAAQGPFGGCVRAGSCNAAAFSAVVERTAAACGLMRDTCAAGPQCTQADPASGCPGYVDRDGDGFCDNVGRGFCSGYADADGDGLCDACGAAASACPGYVDEDADGVCDNFASGSCDGSLGHGCGNGQGDGSGIGRGYGYGNGHYGCARR